MLLRFLLLAAYLLCLVGAANSPALAQTASAAKAATCPREVLAVWMLANSPNNAGANPAVSDYQADLTRLKAYGADGCAVDINGYTGLYPGRLTEIYQAADAVDAKLIPVLDFATLDESKVGAIIQEVYAQPAELRMSDGTPIIATWGGSPAIYAALQRDLALLAGEGLPVACVIGYPPPAYTTAAEAAVYAENPWAAGVSRYNQGASAATLTARIAVEGQAKPAGKLLFAGVSVYFSTAGEKTAKTFGNGTTLTYAKGQLAALLKAKPNILYLVTANDWNQCTGLLPDRPAKNANGVAVPDLSPLLIQAAPYLTAFKAGQISP